MWKTNPSHQACSTQVFLEPLIACSCVLWIKNPKIVIRLSLSLPEHYSRLYQEQMVFLTYSRRAVVVNYKGAARCAKHRFQGLSPRMVPMPSKEYINRLHRLLLLLTMR